MCGASNRLCCFFSSSFRPFSLLYINQPAIQGRRTHIKCFKSFFEYIHFFPSSLRRAYAVRLCVHILKIILHVNVPWIGRKKIYALQSHRHRSERERVNDGNVASGSILYTTNIIYSLPMCLIDEFQQNFWLKIKHIIDAHQHFPNA